MNCVLLCPVRLAIITACRFVVFRCTCASLRCVFCCPFDVNCVNRSFSVVGVFVKRFLGTLFCLPTTVTTQVLDGDDRDFP